MEPCKSRYVGQSVRHLLTRINEHYRKSTPVGSHFQLCNKSTISMDSDVETVSYTHLTLPTILLV